MKRFGALLVFKPGVTLVQAAAALQKLPAELFELRQGREGQTMPGQIESFNDEHGMPVFYIP